MTDPSIVEKVAMALCHYPNGPSPLNSCCQKEPRCIKQAEIALAALDAARAEAGMVVVERAFAKEAFAEAVKRYPNTEGALIFFFIASGLGIEKPTEADMEWARSLVAAAERGDAV